MAAEYPEPFRAQCPGGGLPGDPPAAAQHVAGNGQLVGWRADIGSGVVQNEVLEVDEFTIDPE